MPPWNLTEPFSTSTYRRFHLPVASDSTGGAARPAVPPERYRIEEMEVDGMPRLQVTVPATAEGFPAEGGLPAAVIRLHAMGTGLLSYSPQLGSLRSCLILDLAPGWLRMAVGVKWLHRWLEAGCIPRRVIYDNVDAEALHALLDALPAAQADATPADSLSFPRRVRRQGDSQAWFIDDFMAGAPGASMLAWPGACLGRMGTVDGGPSRRLGLTARYQFHSDATPRPMMPRELFNLLFGIDSDEFTEERLDPQRNHPLLRAIHQVGTSDASEPKTRRMLLRPPLRTHARVVWEAQQELSDVFNALRWSRGESLDDTKLLNTVDHFDRHKEYGLNDDPVNAPNGIYKCQVFGFEMLLRSGFRVRMIRWQRGGQTFVYYYKVNRIVREARKPAGMTASQPGILGSAGETPWGRRWDLVLRSLPQGSQAAEINRMMEEEGRAFYLVNQFEGLTEVRHGHFQLLERVAETVEAGWSHDPPYPIDWEDEGSPTLVTPTEGTISGLTVGGLHWILGQVLEAPGVGARRHYNMFVPGWRSWFEYFKQPARQVDQGSDNNDLLLIEAIPGPDPHTLQGVRSLCSIHVTG